MIIPEVRARLLERLPSFAIVEGAMALATLKGQPTAMPAAYVLAAREVSGENAFGLGGCRQVVQMDFVVVIVTDDRSDARGEANSDALDVLKAEVRAALVGWDPTEAIEPVTHVSGALATVRDNVAWWEETFATAYFLEGQP